MLNVCSSFFTLLPIISGDIGGIMGLLLGGSVITLVEVLDLIVYNLILKLKITRTNQQ